ncbi:nucleolar protein 14 homolog [Diachasma alloeum]|uniref:nucleolar protein 14 homolog n=1 Tax=Diachasma alloeum TaxID=454923 RepID=UPI000738369D|nr:nucleolar protein 14 homolog [Diachasma alloeum]
MVKTKNKKKNLSETAVQKKKQESKKPINPFEVHINKDKQKVLGRKGKADRGLPGVARTKAINKRKHTLLQEFSQRDKDNVFMDKRIGERNASMSQEEKAMARYAAEQIKTHKKKNIYSLNDEEVLTHRGQTLEEIEKFEDPKSDDDFSDDENNKGHLDKKFVTDAHFGGGILSKPDGTLSRKDLIEQLIVESKKRKAEKQKIREQTINLTEKLDTEWKDLLPLMAASKKSTEETVEKPKADDYDIAVRELKFESRGMPSDRLKSEEEIMKEEKEKLEALEQDRLMRMKGFLEESDGRNKHKSADDLDDGFRVEDIEEDDTLAYDEDGVVRNGKKMDKSEGSESEGDDNRDNDDDDEEEDSEGEESTQEDEEKEKGDEEEEIENGKSQETNGNPQQSEANDDESEDSGEEEDDNLSDLKGSESSSEDEEASKITEEQNPSQKSTSDHPKPPALAADSERLQKIREDLQKRKEIMEKARQELPYTYKAPETFEHLNNLLKSQKPDYQSIILERIVKCNHWTLGQGNREKLCKVFEFLLQYIMDCAHISDNNNPEDIIKCFEIFDRISPHLFDLAQANCFTTATCVQNLLKERHEKFEKNQKKFPDLDTLILFKIISLLFPTSDFRHPVVTPAIVFMSQILLRCKVKSKLHISKGLFVSTLMLEYTVLSKRFSPAVINFLRGIIYLGTVKPPLLILKIVPPFKRAGDVANLLVLQEDQTSLEINHLGAHMRAGDLVDGDIDDEFRIRAFLTAVNLAEEFSKQLGELEAVYSIFEPIINLLNINSYGKYPENIRKHVERVSKDLLALEDKQLEYLVKAKKKPKALRLYEPRIERVYDGKKHRPMSKEKAEKEKLMHKLKKEMKGAIREVRRDAAFLAKVQIKNQIKSDTERKRKVREIMNEGAVQQAELNEFKRKKK